MIDKRTEQFVSDFAVFDTKIMYLWRCLITRIIFVLLLPVPSLAAIYDPILDQTKPNSIIIIGETHKKVESVEFFQSLVLDVIKRYQCVVIGLEIASDQQVVLDAVMQGRASVEEITLWPPIDHPPYRQMIKRFAEIKQQYQCIKLIAIDSGLENDVDRDQWMTLKLAEQVGDKPVLVLLGALHTIQKITWVPAKDGHPPLVAQLLLAKGYQIKSYPQRWLEPKICPEGKHRVAIFYRADQPKALAILNESLLSLIRTIPPKTANDVVNGVIAWKCGN